MEVHKIKVLHIISGYGGGISSHIRNLATVIDKDRVTFDVIGFTDYSDDFNKEIGRTGGKTFTFLRPKEVGFSKFYRNALSTMKENGPYDVVLCHTSGYYSLVYKMLSMQAGIKRFVVHAHKTQLDDMEGWTDKARVLMDKIISNGTATQLTSCSTESSEFVFGKKAVKKDKVIHIPNSIPLEKYVLHYSSKEKDIIKDNNHIPLNTLVIGNMGRFNLQKNHMFMIRLIERMVERKLSFVWIFIGAGELEEKIENLVIEKNLSAYVRFLGRREDANELYQIMDVFVLPSFYEGLPTVIVETQAAGIQSVLSDTITKEVDLDLNMLTFLSLEENVDRWIDSIINASKAESPNKETRIKKLNEKGFSNTIASKMYEDFLFGKLTHFRIGDRYESND